MTTTRQEIPKNTEPDCSARPVVERTSRNLLPDFDETEPENTEDDDVQVGGGTGGGDGSGDDDDDDDKD